MTPFEILSVTNDADDNAIRHSYLKLVKEFSPDRAPDKFQEISGAYEAIKDEKKRHHYLLFNTDSSIERPFDAILLHSKQTGKRKPPKFSNLKEWLRKWPME